ncbi:MULTISPECIES: hypothetical protein [Alicyclobacillus]|uniref:Uncharacterized protein n=1 Tax=Alicyclobacillus acidoterrestris (strain ATCC 49025 / DSM 3922 / CIP 106132 / NCIMB 13137 / GD3B) TaxID=1356854 RepID=T0C5S7_ALIAG|nr:MULTISPECIES: hypothetical protein [Alicyclobacillus]EPZ47895.1 hypothetical protein N007_04870 [Alicyclobacillus acidoterrestris ATCC 49025]UNO51038.1 hypothetical protein K1I37_20900 [Alicyclobacillus acidoterrestris]GEO27757.1 hypothetical protein AAC03nite_35420 [Alicyclobacillus acidoterrestris]
MKKRTIGSIALSVIVVVGGGISYFAFSQGKGTSVSTEKPLESKSTPVKSAQNTTAHLISLQAREHTVSSKQAQQYHTIPVITSTGQSKTLDVADSPVVFVSDMDPSILQQLGGGKYKHEPTIVVTWPKPNETVKTELENVQKEAKSLNLKETVVALNGNSKKWITGVPDTYVEKNGKVTEIPGILPANTAYKWTSVFN